MNIPFRLHLWLHHIKIYNFKHKMFYKHTQMYTSYLLRSGIVKKWFLEGIDYFDLNEEKNEISIHISDYNLPNHKIIEKNTEKKISKQRWVYPVFYRISAGYASGILFMDSKFYKIIYSWGGLNSKENWHHRENYTVQIKKKNIGKHIKALSDKINATENYPMKNYLVSKIFIGVVQNIKYYRSYRSE